MQLATIRWLLKKLNRSNDTRETQPTLKTSKQIDKYQYDYTSILGQNTQYNWKSKGRKEENIYLAFQEETCIDDAPSGRKGKGKVCVMSDDDTNELQLLHYYGITHMCVTDLVKHNWWIILRM